VTLGNVVNEREFNYIFGAILILNNVSMTRGQPRKFNVHEVFSMEQN